MERLAPAELEQIVLHENEHLRRGDDWINLIQKISLVLFPLNPVLIWIEGRLCSEREMACDDGVVEATGSARAYASCLTTLAQRSLEHRAASLALGAWERRSSLARRVQGILHRGRALTPLQARSLTGAIVLGLVCGAVGLSRCPQLVSFSAEAQPAAPIAATQQRLGTSSARFENASDKGSPIPGVTVQNTTLNTSRPRKARLLRASLTTTDRPLHPRRREQLEISARPQAELVGFNAGDAGDRSWLVITTWQVSGSQPMVFTLLTDQPDLVPSIPAANGWIFIQL